MALTNDKTIYQLYRELLLCAGHMFSDQEKRVLKQHIRKGIESKKITEESLSAAFYTALVGRQELGLGHSAMLSVLLFDVVSEGIVSLEELEQNYKKSVSIIVGGLLKAKQLYAKNAALETENFRKLLLSFADDIRVILILIVERLTLMRSLDRYDDESQMKIAREASYLYAPLAHRLGLYAVKTELEDLSLKYTSRQIYKDIAHKLNQTKGAREKYIAEFINPVKTKLKASGLRFEIKGRTKSIYSIWNKMKKQQIPFEKIYDLFAIRVIIDTDFENEKAACWQAYSIVTDMYQPNPNRLRDWLSIPKSNGYESLHITVMGPEGKWVEVQIRTARMDEIAEKGLAAHWKYKGGKSESQAMDQWLKNIRDLLETPDIESNDVINEFKLNLYEDDVFVFTPKGDLQRLKAGSTILDFAFSIHTNIGSHCVGALVNEKHVPIKYKLKNGDQVSILTSPTQKPKADWLQNVFTSKARTKIKQVLKEYEFKDADTGKEMLLRRLKNWKMEYNESVIAQIAKKSGYKTISDFYQAITHEKINILTVREMIEDLNKKESGEPLAIRTAEGFQQETDLEKITKEDVLVIDQNLKDIDYKLAKCCNPIYGDEIFGFVSINGGIKIHRMDCPNAPQMIARFGYRIVNARWSGKSEGSQYPITLRIVGHDDIGIVTNITSVISKEHNVNMRSISVDSHDGFFEGNITVMVSEVHKLEQLIKKLKTIKGVKQITRN